MKTNKSMYEVIQNDKRFSILLKVLSTIGVEETLNGKKESLTFFAPVNQAFEELPEKVFKLLFKPQGKFLAAAILEQHTIPKEKLSLKDLENVNFVNTVFGNKLEIVNQNEHFYVTDSQILGPEIQAKNGVVIAVDKLLPVRREALTARKSSH